MKLYKLLFLLDFEHFRALGRSVTGLEYEAWEMGPVPASFDREWRNNLQADWRVGLRPETLVRQFDYDDPDAKQYEIKKLIATKSFEEQLFSKREMEILRTLAKQYFRTTASEMSMQSHAAFGYWDEVWNHCKQPKGAIPYSLVFDRQNNEQDKLLRNFANERAKFANLSE